MVGSVARSVYLVAAVLLVVGACGQVFLAGLGVFAGQANFTTHRDFGFMLELLPVMVVAALVGRMGRTFIGGAALLIVLFGLQSVFIAVRTSQPGVAALHPLNGFLILLVAIYLSVASWRTRTARSDRTASKGG